MRHVSEIVVPLGEGLDLHDLMSGLQTSLQSLRRLLNVASTGAREWGFPTDKDDECHAIDEYMSYLEAVAATVYNLQVEELNTVDNSTAQVKDGGDPS
jgi:hypothetical protein